MRLIDEVLKNVRHNQGPGGNYHDESHRGIVIKIDDCEHRQTKGRIVVAIECDGGGCGPGEVVFDLLDFINAVEPVLERIAKCV